MSSIKKKIEALQLQRDSAVESVERMKELIRDAVTMVIASSAEMEDLKKRLNYLERVHASAQDTLVKVTATLEEKKNLLIATRKEKAKVEAIVLERKIRRLQKLSAAAKISQKQILSPVVTPNVVQISTEIETMERMEEGKSEQDANEQATDESKENFCQSADNTNPEVLEEPELDEETQRRILEMEEKLKVIGNRMKSLRTRMLKQQLRAKLPSRMQKRQIKIRR